MMPSTRKQKANEKHSRQSDVLSDMENTNVMLENFPKNCFERQDAENESEVDLYSMGLHRDTNQIGNHFRSLLNSNVTEHS